MSVGAEYQEFLKDILSGLGPVSIRKMFGGGGVYFDGVMFGLIADDTLYLKADADFARAFEAEGEGPFVYETEGRKPIAMSYWRVPGRLLDEPDALVQWARQAHDVACREKSRKTPGRQSGKPA